MYFCLIYYITASYAEFNTDITFLVVTTILLIFISVLNCYRNFDHPKNYVPIFISVKIYEKLPTANKAISLQVEKEI